MTIMNNANAQNLTGVCKLYRRLSRYCITQSTRHIPTYSDKKRIILLVHLKHMNSLNNIKYCSNQYHNTTAWMFQRLYPYK